MDDALLVERAKAGERAAFGALVERHRAYVLRSLSRSVGSPDLIEDAFQSACVVAMEKMRQNDGRFAPWFATIARRLALDVIRNRVRRGRREAAGFDPNLAPTEVPGPGERLERTEEAVRVQRAVAGLTPKQAEAVRLARFEGLSADEGGARTGLSAQTFKSRLHLGMKNLEKTLA